MPEIDDRVLDRVRKLLAKAEHPSTPAAEAEVFSGKAAELMARYALDQAMLTNRTIGAGAPEVRAMTVHSPYSLAKAILLSRVAAAHRVCVAVGGDGRHLGRLCTLVGFPIDLDTVEMLFTSLLVQASFAMQAASAGAPRVKAFRRAFLMGYAASIGRRLEEVQRHTVAEASGGEPSVALVLADRDRLVSAAFEREFPDTRRLRTTVSDGGGLVAGRAAGARADLSDRTGRISRRQRAIGA